MTFTTSSSHANSRAPSAASTNRQRSDELSEAINLWLGERNLSKAMEREELAQIEGFQRVLAIRNGLLCAAIGYIRQTPRADSTLGVLMLIGFLCDNNDGLCRVGVKRMAEIFNRSEVAMSATIARLSEAGRIGVIKNAGLSDAYWIKIPAEMAHITANTVDFVNALSPRPAPYYRRAHQVPVGGEPSKSILGVNRAAPHKSTLGVTPQVDNAEPPKPTDHSLYTSNCRISKKDSKGVEQQLALHALASLARDVSSLEGSTSKGAARRAASGLCDITAILPPDGSYCWGEKGMQYLVEHDFQPNDVRRLFGDWRDDRIKHGKKFKGEVGWWLDFQQWVRREAQFRDERGVGRVGSRSRVSSLDEIADMAFGGKGNSNG